MVNSGKPYRDQIKPFNFLLTAHLPHFAAPPSGQTPERFQLIAPWEPDPSRWLELDWVNKYASDRERFELTTSDEQTAAGVARVQSYRDVLDEYRVHPEPKSLAPSGKPAGWHGIGLLARRPVTATRLVHIGKESNELESLQAGIVHELGDVVNEYVASDRWRDYVLPVLRKLSRSQLREWGLSGTNVSRVKAGTFRGTARTRTRLAVLTGDLARERLRDEGITPPADPIDCCAAYLEVVDR